MSVIVAPELSPQPTTPVIVSVRDVFKIYSKPGTEMEVRALDGVTMDIHQGEMVAIMGASGSGKSTLMNIFGCLDRPTFGSYVLGGRDITHMSDDELSEFRGARLGFIFQNFNLIPQLTVAENLEVPLFYQMVPPAQRRQRAHEMAGLVGLEQRLDHRPQELSGGQQQRVAVARALMNDPLFLLADEPTGNLDSKTGAAILEMIHKLHDMGKTIVIVTHDPAVGAQCSRRVVLRDGKIIEDLRQAKYIAAQIGGTLGHAHI